LHFISHPSPSTPILNNGLRWNNDKELEIPQLEKLIPNPSTRQLIKSLLSRDPAKRGSSTQLLVSFLLLRLVKHFFTDIHIHYSPILTFYNAHLFIIPILVKIIMIIMMITIKIKIALQPLWFVCRHSHKICVKQLYKLFI
jgi:serine/threonine protein kinase